MTPHPDTDHRHDCSWSLLGVRDPAGLILGFHDLVVSPSANTEWAIDDFSDLMDYIASKDVAVLTFSEVWELSLYDKTGIPPV